MKILITGANGFIGNELFSLFNQNYNVTGTFGRKDIDLTNFFEVEKLFEQKFDLVIHCATQGRYNHLDINDDVLKNNLKIFLNLSFFKSQYTKFINIGSGAEFDMTKNIENISENDIFSRHPISSYGLSKNFIARCVRNLDNFYTLRLFGCVSNNLPENTLMYNFVKSMSKGENFDLKDNRYFDFFTINDLKRIIEYYISNTDLEKDVNLTYNKKFKLSEFLYLCCNIRGYDKNLIRIKNESQINYTGNNKNLNKLNVELLGLEETIQNIKTIL